MQYRGGSSRVGPAPASSLRRGTSLPALALALALVLLTACAAPQEDVRAPRQAPRPRRAASSPPGDAAATRGPEPAMPTLARIEGIVRYTGTAPLRVKQLTNDIDVPTCGERIHLETVLLGKDSAVANVFVELRRDDGGLIDPARGLPAAANPSQLSVSIHRCSLEPHVLVVPAGSAVEVRNEDGILHDLIVPCLANPPLEARLPRYRKRLLLPADALRRPERLQVTCDAHPFEVGWWIVTDNAFHALTGADGRFAFPDVPPGTWTILAWHEDLGRLEAEITVTSEQPAITELDFR